MEIMLPAFILCMIASAISGGLIVFILMNKFGFE